MDSDIVLYGHYTCAFNPGRGVYYLCFCYVIGSFSSHYLPGTATANCIKACTFCFSSCRNNLIACLHVSNHPYKATFTEPVQYARITYR